MYNSVALRPPPVLCSHAHCVAPALFVTPDGSPLPIRPSHPSPALPASGTCCPTLCLCVCHLAPSLSGVVQSVPSGDGLLSPTSCPRGPSMMQHMSLLPPFSWLCHIPRCRRTYHVLSSVHLLVDGHVGGFHLLAIVNSTAVSTCVGCLGFLTTREAPGSRCWQ